MPTSVHDPHDPGSDAAGDRAADVATAAVEPIEVPGGGRIRIGTASWTDPTMTAYLGYEQSGDGGTHHRVLPYPYYGGYPMSPHRAVNEPTRQPGSEDRS